MSKKALQAFIEFQESPGGHGHPSSPSTAGQLAANALETARGKIASLLGAKSSQIVFTSTASEAAEWAVSILANKCNKIYYSPFEHSCIKDSIENINIEKHLLNSNNGMAEFYNIENSGIICMLVQNETGVIQPIELIPKGCSLLSDLCQAVGVVSLDLKSLNASLAFISGHKIGGGAVGILYIKDPNWWKEKGAGNRWYLDRSGTPDVAGIVATSTALEETLFNMPENLAKCREFQSALEERLENMCLTILCKNSPRVPSTTFVHIPGYGMHLLLDLSKEGIIVGLGSACNSLNTGASLSIRALEGYKDSGPHDFIRISQKGQYGKKEALLVADKIYNGLKKYGQIRT